MILVATPYAEDKLHCLQEFLGGIAAQTKKPDRILFVLDAARKRPRSMEAYLTTACRKSIPDIAVDFGTVPVYQDHIEAIGQARNVCLDHAKKLQAVYVWFLDADIRPTENALDRLLLCNEGISGALVCTRELPLGFSRRPSKMNTYRMIKQGDKDVFAPKTDFKVGEVIDVDTTGNDCMVVSRNVFNAQKYRWVLEQPRVAEDFAFCMDAKKNGFKVKVDTGVWCEHFSPVEVFSTMGGSLSRKPRFGE